MHLCVLSHFQLLWPQGHSPPASSAHVNFQERILEWVSISYSRGSSQSRDQTCVPCISKWNLYHWATWEDPWKRIFCSKSRKDRPMRNTILSGWQPPESFSLQPLSMMLPKGIWVTPHPTPSPGLEILCSIINEKKKVTEQWRDPKPQRPYSENKRFFLAFPSPKFFSSLTHSVTLQNDFPMRGSQKTAPSNWKLIYFPFLSFQEIKTPDCPMLCLWNRHVVTEYGIMAHLLIVLVLCELLMAITFLRLLFCRKLSPCVNGMESVFQICLISLMSQSPKAYIAVIVCIVKVINP